MKLYKLSLIALAMLGLTFTACEPKPEPEPTPEPEVIPSSFPRKHLIEEFTGQDCGYCPYGMDCVHAFMENDTNFILVLHHYGYSPDHFSVTPSKTITSALKVSGAPSVSIDRTKTRSEAGSKLAFHPGYLPSVSKSQFVDTTYASVNIQNTYNAGTRELKVVVSGVVCKEDYPDDLSLTVMIKESGMIDYQADYYDTFEGWQQFRHANAVRAFLTTNAKGDLIAVQSNQHYKEEYTITLNDAWVPENCMVVAVLSEAFQPVVQAAEKPVVEGTKGGADILHGGITPAPVADFYPEPNATDGPEAFSGNKAETLNVSNAYYQQYPSDGYTMWIIQAQNLDATLTINNTVCIPFAWLYLIVPYSATPTLPIGTFPINTTEQTNTLIAGYRVDAPTQYINGSKFYFTGLDYFQQGYLNAKAQWLIADGEMVITAEGWTINGHARNGADIKMVGAPLQNGGSANAPTRIQARVP